MLGFYKPTALRGKLEKNRYFEGWFQKIYSKEYNTSFIVIYGYTTQNSEDKFGFIQILFPNHTHEIIYFNKNEVSFNSVSHIFKLGENMMSTELIKISTNDFNINIQLLNNEVINTFKNTMGYNYFVPKLPCYHSVLNTAHNVYGEIQWKNDRYDLNNELGYLEKNWGTSFPDSYLWFHAVDPNNPKCSILFSIAKVKWLGFNFIKHIGHFYFEDVKLDFRKVNKKGFLFEKVGENTWNITIIWKFLKIAISIRTNHQVLLKGPKNGVLVNDVNHFSCSEIQIQVAKNENIINFKLIGNFEYVGELNFLNIDKSKIYTE